MTKASLRIINLARWIITVFGKGVALLTRLTSEVMFRNGMYCIVLKWLPSIFTTNGFAVVSELIDCPERTIFWKWGNPRRKQTKPFLKLKKKLSWIIHFAKFVSVSSSRRSVPIFFFLIQYVMYVFFFLLPHTRPYLICKHRSTWRLALCTCHFTDTFRSH